jgi:acyl-ACP thioesterase
METNSEIRFSEMESNKHLNNIMYGVWEEDYDEETLPYY